MPSSGAFWKIRRQPRAAPLDIEEPRILLLLTFSYLRAKGIDMLLTPMH
jgi:hypothetical protein